MSERTVNSGSFLQFLTTGTTLYAQIKMSDPFAMGDSNWSMGMNSGMNVEVEVPFANWSIATDGKLTLGTTLEWDIPVPSEFYQSPQSVTVEAVRFVFGHGISNPTIVFSENITENNVFETEGKFRITSFKIPVSVVT